MLYLGYYPTIKYFQYLNYLNNNIYAKFLLINN